MAHRLRASLLSRFLLMLVLIVPFLAPRPLDAQDTPTRWQPLGGAGGQLTHLIAGPSGRDLYAVSAASVRRQDDQTQWRDAGIGTEAYALYASRDAGANWQALTNDLPPGRITALQVDENARLWAGLQMSGNAPENRQALWRSDDLGRTWRSVPLDRSDLTVISIVEDASGEILLGALDAAGVEQGLVYRTADDGATWSISRLSFGSESLLYLAALVAHPSRAGVLFALAANGQVLRSADYGTSWLPTAETESKDQGSARLTFLPDRPDTAILVQSRWAETSVLRSTDSGATWSDVATAGWPNGLLGIRSMVALPRGVLLLNTDAGTYRSADAGAGWQPLEGALSSGFVHAWAAPRADGQGVLAATGYGLFASSDAGALWRAYGTGLPSNSGVAALLTHEDRPTQIAASLVAPGDADPPELLLTRDGGRTWLPADGGAQWSDATAWAIDPNNPDNLYVAGQDYVAVSEDGGISWKVQKATTVTRTAIAVAPSDSSRVYVDGAPCLRSKDGGRTWAELPLQSHEGRVEIATGLAVDPADPDHLWRGGVDGVEESRDGGDTWQRSGLDGQTIRWLAAAGRKDPGPAALFAGIGDGGIMRKDAAAADWLPADSGLPAGSAIIAFVSDPRTPGLLWAARDGGGVYRSTDGGGSWSNVGVGVGDNLGLALAVNYQAAGSVLMGTATAGVWVLGSGGPAPAASETPAGSPTSAPSGQDGRSGVDARIEVLWPHAFAPIDEAELANLGVRLFNPRSLEPPACGWRPKVQLWRAIDNEPAEPIDTAEQRSVDGQPFPYWEANDVDVSAAKDPARKVYFLIGVEGIDTATSVWAHASDARTFFPEQQVPSGIATGDVDAVDARIQIVWPHDDRGAEASVSEATRANVAVTLFKHDTRLSVSPSWQGQVMLFGAWNAEMARRLSTAPAVSSRQAGVITYPVWEFNDIPVDRAMDGSSKLYFWAVAQGVKSYPTIWAHGVDSRTFFPAKDEPIQGCLP